MNQADQPKKVKQKRAPRGMGHLYKRSNAYWLEYRVNGKRTRQALHAADGKPITTKREAEAEQIRITAPFRSKDAVETQLQIMSRLETAEAALGRAIADAEALRVADAVEAYKQHPERPDSGPRTLKGYISQFERFAVWIKKKHPDAFCLRDVTPDIARGYVKDLDADKVSASTFNQHIGTLKRFWKVLAEDAHAKSNPWERIKKRTVEKIDRRKRALSLDEVNTVIEAAPADLRDLLILVACTGQRLVDIVKLQWSSVDLPAGVLELPPRKTKRRKLETIFVPILPHARAILESIGKRSAYVFPALVAEYDKDGGAALSKRIQATIEGAGIQTTRPPDNGGRAIVVVGVHSFRHTFNTLARAAGIPDAVVKKITGHTGTAMTDHYTQFDRALVAKMAQVFETLPTASARLELAQPAEAREPLPQWATVLLKTMSAENWQELRGELLGDS